MTGTYDVSGKAEEGEIVQRKKAYQAEEMYDGGDAEEVPAEEAPAEEAPAEEAPAEDAPAEEPGTPAPAPEDAGHELMDMDKLEQQEGGMQIIAKSRLKRVKDWRVKKVSWISAFFSKSLRPNDMQFIYSLLAAFVAWVIATIIMMSTSETAA